MKTKTLLTTVLIVLIALSGIANAIEYSVFSRTISVQIENEKEDTVIERFYISFPSENEKIAFREKSIELGTDLTSWKEFNPLFEPSIGKETLNKKIFYNDAEQSYLQLNYSLKEPIMAKDKETSLITEYIMKTDYFNSFYEAGLWIIPENTKIMIELPAGAEIKENIEPQAEITSNMTRKVVNWQGYKSANRLSLRYVVWKKIPPVIDLNEIPNFLVNTEKGKIILAIIAVMLGAIIWKRKMIVNKIENFVEKNSEIKQE